MLAAVLEALDQLKLQEVKTPKLDDDSALLRSRIGGICGSDVRILHHGNRESRHPQSWATKRPGRRGVGKNVTRVRGDHIAIGADVPCGQCRWCRNGLGNNCSVNYAVAPVRRLCTIHEVVTATTREGL